MGLFLIFFHAGWQKEEGKKAEGIGLTNPPKAVDFLAYEFAEQQENFHPGKKNSRTFLFRVKTCAARKAGGQSFLPPSCAVPKPERENVSFPDQMGLWPGSRTPTYQARGWGECSVLEGSLSSQF